MDERFEIIVGDEAAYADACDLPADMSSRATFLAHITEVLACAEAKKQDVAYLKALPAAENPADNFQQINYQEGAVVEYIKAHEYPQKIRIVCTSADEQGQYQMTYNFFYAVSKADRMGLDKWD